MIAQSLKYLGIFLLWNIAVGSALLLLDPRLGLLLALAASAAILWLYLLRAGQPGERRRWAVLRLRPLEGEVLKWTIVAVPVLLALSWALGEVYTSLVPVPPETFNPFGDIVATAWGRLSIAILAVAIAPILEEFFFRGLIQRPLERYWGGARAVWFTAFLFALVHLLPWVFPLHLFLGLVFGWVVYVTRSIWSGVILHAANNAAAMVGLGMGDDPTLRPTVWQLGLDAAWWTALGVLVLSAAAAVWVARKLWRAARAVPSAQ